MIGLYKDDGTRLLISYNGANLNSNTDTPYSKYEVNDIIPMTAVESVREARPNDDGSIASAPRKTQRVIRMRGMVRADTYAALFDAAEYLASQIDASLAQKLQGTPFSDLLFSVPTADTTNWPTGLIACSYSAEALGSLDSVTSQGNGKVIPFTIDFYLKDPRRYSQARVTITGSATGTNKGDYVSYPIVTITASGAGSATYSIARTGAGTVTLNLSGLVNTDVVTVDMDAQSVKKNGVDAANLIVGTPGWFFIQPGSNTITVTNGTNMTTLTKFYHAWAD